MFFYKNAPSLRNDSYAKPSAKKFLKQQFFRYCFITGARSRTPGVFHVNVFSSSYIVYASSDLRLEKQSLFISRTANGCGYTGKDIID